MRKLIAALMLSACFPFMPADAQDVVNSDSAQSQAQEKPVMRGNYYNKDLNISLKLNAYSKSIAVPGFEMDSCYGYLQGAINGTWVMLKVKEQDADRVLIRTVSDRGGDACDLEIKAVPEGVTLRQTDGQPIKGVANGKYVKLPKVITFSK